MSYDLRNERTTRRGLRRRGPVDKLNDFASIIIIHVQINLH